MYTVWTKSNDGQGSVYSYTLDAESNLSKQGEFPIPYTAEFPGLAFHRRRDFERQLLSEIKTENIFFGFCYLAF